MPANAIVEPPGILTFRLLARLSCLHSCNQCLFIAWFSLLKCTDIAAVAFNISTLVDDFLFFFIRNAIF